MTDMGRKWRSLWAHFFVTIPHLLMTVRLLRKMCFAYSSQKVLSQPSILLNQTMCFRLLFIEILLCAYLWQQSKRWVVEPQLCADRLKNLFGAAAVATNEKHMHKIHDDLEGVTVFEVLFTHPLPRRTRVTKMTAKVAWWIRHDGNRQLPRTGYHWRQHGDQWWLLPLDSGYWIHNRCWSAKPQHFPRAPLHQTFILLVPADLVTDVLNPCWAERTNKSSLLRNQQNIFIWSSSLSLPHFLSFHFSSPPCS